MLMYFCQGYLKQPLLGIKLYKGQGYLKQPLFDIKLNKGMRIMSLISVFFANTANSKQIIGKSYPGNVF